MYFLHRRVHSLLRMLSVRELFPESSFIRFTSIYILNESYFIFYFCEKVKDKVINLLFMFVLIEYTLWFPDQNGMQR